MFFIALKQSTQKKGVKGDETPKQNNDCFNLGN